MGGGGEHVLDEVAFLSVGADDSGAASALFSVSIDGHSLYVAGMADGNDDLLGGDEVLDVECFGLLCGDLSSSLVTVFLLHFLDIFANYGHKDVIFKTESKEVLEYLSGKLREGDIVLTLGAGPVWKIGEAFLSSLE